MAHEDVRSGGATQTFPGTRSRCTPQDRQSRREDLSDLTFRRVFKGSSPEFIEITVREDSDTAAYEIRQLDEDAGSLPFQVSAAWRTKMFDLAAQLKHFQGQDLDVHRKIANLGEKTFQI